MIFFNLPARAASVRTVPAFSPCMWNRGCTALTNKIAEEPYHQQRCHPEYDDVVGLRLWYAVADLILANIVYLPDCVTRRLILQAPDERVTIP
jgi:hypothetical protein